MLHDNLDMVGHRQTDTTFCNLNKVPFSEIKKAIIIKAKEIQLKTRKCCFKLFKKPPQVVEISTQIEVDPLTLKLENRDKTIKYLNVKVDNLKREIENVNKSITIITEEKTELKKKVYNLESLYDVIDELKTQIKGHLEILKERKTVIL